MTKIEIALLVAISVFSFWAFGSIGVIASNESRCLSTCAPKYGEAVTVGMSFRTVCVCSLLKGAK